MSPPLDQYGAFQGPDSSGSLVTQLVLDFLFVFLRKEHLAAVHTNTHTLMFSKKIKCHTLTVFNSLASHSELWEDKPAVVRWFVEKFACFIQRFLSWGAECDSFLRRTCSQRSCLIYSSSSEGSEGWEFGEKNMWAAKLWLMILSYISSGE